MKKYLVLVMALLLTIVPFSARAEEDEPIVFYESEEVDGEYLVDDYYESDYEDDDDYYYYDDEDYYYMEADETLDLDSESVISCNEEKKLFTASNIIFLAAGMITGVLLTIVAVACTRNRCTCGCNCECNKEKEEKKEKKTTKKNDK